MTHLLKEKYIIVYQDVRGRYMSEGAFEDVRPYNPNKKKKEFDDNSDTYDTIDWLVKNVANNNGKVGIFGTSYPGFYSTMALPDAHPALKALSPQAPVTNWFIDDDESIFEDVINRFAGAGITLGCNPPANTEFCPEEGVSRGQMAAFMTRALDLPPAEFDYFSDDNGSTFEADINAFAAAGLTSGCGDGLFCPSRNLSRGEMAAFLAKLFPSLACVSVTFSL